MTGFELGQHEHKGFLVNARYTRSLDGTIWDIHRIAVTPEMGIFSFASAYCDGWESIEIRIDS